MVRLFNYVGRGVRWPNVPPGRAGGWGVGGGWPAKKVREREEDQLANLRIYLHRKA